MIRGNRSTTVWPGLGSAQLGLAQLSSAQIGPEAPPPLGHPEIWRPAADVSGRHSTGGLAASAANPLACTEDRIAGRVAHPHTHSDTHTHAGTRANAHKEMTLIAESRREASQELLISRTRHESCTSCNFSSF